MDIVRDIHAYTTFRNNSATFLRRLQKTGRPVILTVNGRAAAVVQDAQSYQRLLDIAAQADAREGIRQGIDQIKSGRGRTARQLFDELRAEYGIPR